jgi:hypothetical protein
MENNIVDKIENLIESNVPDNAQINDFIRVTEEYQKLVNEGLTIKRGFNLMTTEEIYNDSSNYSLNQTF